MLIVAFFKSSNFRPFRSSSVAEMKKKCKGVFWVLTGIHIQCSSDLVLLLPFGIKMVIYPY
jgi:hypothetical protein